MSRQTAKAMENEQLFIAQIGRTVGLHGDLKLHLHTDFPEQFQVGVSLESSRGTLEIAAYNPTRGLARFVGYESIEMAKKLTNTKLYSTPEQTKLACILEEGEHFWFDIIGSSIYEGELLLGIVKDIDRMPSADYLMVKTEQTLVEAGFAKDFLLPYIPRYIFSVDSEAKKIQVLDAKEILEAS